MYYTVDRIEGCFAVLEAENGDTEDVRLTCLPKDVKEGDILKFEDGIYTIDPIRTRQLKENLEERLNKLFLN